MIQEYWPLEIELEKHWQEQQEEAKLQQVVNMQYCGKKEAN